MILELEKQVVSLELAKQLKDAGFPQETLFYWIKDDFSLKVSVIIFDDIADDLTYDVNGFKVAAPTVAELGKALQSKDYAFFLWGYWLEKRDCFDLVCETADRKEIINETRADTESDARALMWLWLKKDGKI